MYGDAERIAARLFMFRIILQVSDVECDDIHSGRDTGAVAYTSWEEEEDMARQSNTCTGGLAFLLVFVLISPCVPVEASDEQTKTVEFNVKPGGVVHTFSEGIVSDCTEGCLQFMQ